MGDVYKTKWVMAGLLLLGAILSGFAHGASCPRGKICNYVSQSGSDSASGAESSPWKTLKYALKKTPSGGYIFLNRGDVWFIHKSGYVIDKPNITLDAYGQGSKPVLDGNFYYFPTGSDWSPYLPAIQVGSPSDDQSGAHATIRNIEIRESGGECIRVYSRNTMVDQVFCNGSFGQGIQFRAQANDSTLKNSITYNHNFGAYGVKKGANLETARYGNNLDLINTRHGLKLDKRRKKMQCYATYGTSSELDACNGQGWGAGNFTRALRTTFMDNVIHAGWGESVIVGCGARDALVDGLTVVDGKVGIYLDGGSGSVIRNNMVMGTGQSKYFRGSSAGEGIGLNREPYCLRAAEKLGRADSTNSVEIYNNLISGRAAGLFFWAEVSTEYRGVRIYNNAFVNNVYGASFASGTHVDTLIANNLFVNTGSDPKVKGLLKGFGSAQSGFIFRNNYWSYEPERASSYVAGSQTQSLIGHRIDLAKTSGYFNVVSDDFKGASWVTKDWLDVTSSVLTSSGLPLKAHDVVITQDLSGKAISDTNHIGPLSGAVSLQARPIAPYDIKVSTN